MQLICNKELTNSLDQIKNDPVKRHWTSLVVVALAVTSLSMQWAVLHAISFGTEVLNNRGCKDFSIVGAFAKSFTEHSNCSVCDYLNEKRSEQDRKSTQKNVVIDIKAVTASLGVVISSETIWADDLTGPSSINLEFIDSIIPPPPQSAV